MNSTMIVCLVIFALTVASYVWGKIPMALTAMLSLAAFILTGALEPAAALSNFGNNNAIMIMSMFVVAAGFQRTKFIGNVAASVSRFANGSMAKVMAGYVIISIILSQFIQSPLIVFSIMCPMMVGTCEEMGISRSKVMFPLGIAAIATCSAFPLGSGATVAAELNGYLTANEYTTFQVALTDPMKARFPVVIVCAIYCIFFASRFAPDKQVDEAAAKAAERKRAEKPALPPFAETAGVVIFFGVTLALIFNAQIMKVIPNAQAWVVCMVGSILMVACGVLNGRKALQSLNLSIPGILFCVVSVFWTMTVFPLY